MFNPWPCGTLQEGVKILAIIEMVICGILLLVFGFVFLGAEALAGSASGPNSAYAEDAAELARIGAIVMIILVLILFALAMVLYCGATQRDASRCWIWLISSGIILIICTVINANEGMIGGWLFGIYKMVVVYAFIQEVNLGPMAAMGGYPGGFPGNAVGPAPYPYGGQQYSQMGYGGAPNQYAPQQNPQGYQPQYPPASYSQQGYGGPGPNQFGPPQNPPSNHSSSRSVEANP